MGNVTAGSSNEGITLGGGRSAEWVRDMIDYHARTGAYRPEDLRRLLGDPTGCVSIGPGPGMLDALARHGEAE